MHTVNREPIGLRVLLHALRPDDREPFWLWRMEPEAERDALLERGATEQAATLWTLLLRWSEAQMVAHELRAAGWIVTFHGIRALTLDRITAYLHPPAPNDGWEVAIAGLVVRAVPAEPTQDEAALVRLLASLET